MINGLMGSQLASECPKGHPLSPRVTPVVGGCDGPCGRKVGKGEMVRDCRQCNYYICSSCVPTCRNGHALAPRITPTGGGCDGPCRRKVGKGESVFDCRQCNWYLCTTCMPLKEAVKASSGGPDVDMRSVAEALPSLPPCDLFLSHTQRDPEVCCRYILSACYCRSSSPASAADSISRWHHVICHQHWPLDFIDHSTL